MLRRQQFFVRSSTKILTCSSIITNSSSLRFNSSSSNNNNEVSAEELAHRAKLEALARERLGLDKVSSASSLGRSREFGTPSDIPKPDTPAENLSQQPPFPGMFKGKRAAAAAAASEMPPHLQEPKSSTLKVERHRDADRPTEPRDAAAASRIADLKKNHPSAQASSASSEVPPSTSEKQQQPAAASSSSTSEQQQQSQQQQEPIAGSPMSAQGGTKIVFDVPEGDLPQQASYDPWAILGLKPGASNHDLRVRYHELLEQYHPEYVRDGSGGDVQKWAEVDRAYQLVTRAPAHDKRYRNLISDSQHFYYKYLPMWMARNVDEMPRWWSWMRWKLPTFWFVSACLGVIYVIGKVYAYYPNMGLAAMICFVSDVLLHTTSFPVMIGVMFVTLLFSGGNVDMAWLTSPKGFLRRPLAY